MFSRGGGRAGQRLGSSDMDNKDYITVEELMQQLNVTIITIKRMIGKGELPEFTYGADSKSKVKGWHKKALEAHAVQRAIGNQ